MDHDTKREMDRLLLAGIKSKLPELKLLLGEVSDRWGYEDGVYRFYHQSIKAFCLQELTERVVEALRSVAPAKQALHPWFLQIVGEGTGIQFAGEAHNANWPKHVRPIVEAFLHAKYFLEMAVKYGAELDEAPDMFPSGWGSLLELFGIR